MHRVILTILITIIWHTSVAGRHWGAVDHTFDTLNHKMDSLLVIGRGSLPQMDSLLDEMKHTDIDNPDATRLAAIRLMYWEANISFAEGHAKDCNELLTAAIAGIDSTLYPYDHARIRQLAISVNNPPTQYIANYHHLKHNIDVFSRYGDDVNLAISYFTLGHLLTLIGSPDRALDYLRKSENLFGNSGRKTVAQLMIYEILNELNRKDEARQILHHILNADKFKNDSSFMAVVMISAYSYATDEAEKNVYVREAFRISQQLHDSHNLAVAKYNLGEYLLDKESADSAFTLIKESMQYFHEAGVPELYAKGCRSLSDIFAARELWDSAYIYSAQYMHIDDSLRIDKSLKAIQQRENIERLSSYEQELEYQKSKHLLSLAIFSLTIIIISVGMAYLIHYMRTKRNLAEIKRQLKEAENAELTATLENEQLKSEIYREEIAKKDREATTSALLISEKNRLLESIGKRIASEGESGNITHGTVVKLRSQIRSQMSADDDWQYFKLRFDAVHPDFFIKLKRAVPSLTEKELHLCAYICIGMSNEQLTRVLSVGADAIKKARYRLKKKLPLGDNETIETFVRSIAADNG